MNRHTLSASMLLVVTLLSPLGFAGEREKANDANGTGLKASGAVISAFVTASGVRDARKALERIDAVKESRTTTVKSFKAIVKDASVEDNLVLNDPKIKNADVRLQKLEEEYRSLYWKLTDAKNGKGGSAGQLNIHEAETRLAQIHQEAADIKTWFPAEKVNRARARVENINMLRSTKLHPNRKVFSEVEVKMLLSLNKSYLDAIHQAATHEASFIKKRNLGRGVGAVGGVATAVLMGSAISDLMKKSPASSASGEGTAPAQKQSGTASSGSPL